MRRRPGQDLKSSRDQTIAFVQFGNYCETVDRFAGGLGETYFAQRYSVDFVERLPETYKEVHVITVACRPHDRVLESGVHCIGVDSKPHTPQGIKDTIDALKACSPTTVIVRFPSASLVEWCLKTGRRVLPLLADSFSQGPIPTLLARWRLARRLNRAGVDFVANHQVPASRDLARIGVSSSKIIPWDWPSDISPADHSAKGSVAVPGRISAMFSGKVVEGKGVGDLIRAVALLNRTGVPASATIAGDGDIPSFKNLAEDLGVLGRIDFKGLVPHSQVLAMMRDSDTVVVPSRHNYGEGLPMTVFDALTSRSPLVVSDHPMFAARLEPGRSALVFPEKDAEALAGRLRGLVEDKTLYRSLSESSATTWDRLQVPLKWAELVGRWLSGSAEDLRWLSRYTLANHAYG